MILRELSEKPDRLDMDVNIYLEDWSNGMINSEDYVFYMLDTLKE